MILQFKTKKKVIVNPVTLSEDYVKLIIERESERTPLATGVMYRYQSEDGTIIKSGNWTVTNEELNYISTLVDRTGKTEIECRNEMIAMGVLYTLNEYPDFGLTPNDWELYVDPIQVEEPIEKPIEDNDE